MVPVAVGVAVGVVVVVVVVVVVGVAVGVVVVVAVGVVVVVAVAVAVVVAVGVAVGVTGDAYERIRVESGAARRARPVPAFGLKRKPPRYGEYRAALTAEKVDANTSELFGKSNGKGRSRIARFGIVLSARGADTDWFQSR